MQSHSKEITILEKNMGNMGFAPKVVEAASTNSKFKSLPLFKKRLNKHYLPGMRDSAWPNRRDGGMSTPKGSI